MARKIYSQLVGTIDDGFVHPVIDDGTILDSIIHMGSAGGRDWFSFDDANVTVDDSQDAKYGVTIYASGHADTAAVKSGLSYLAQQADHRKALVTNAHGQFDLIEAVINSNATITDKFAAARAAIDAEETELGF
jgi:hypothetical protein